MSPLVDPRRPRHGKSPVHVKAGSVVYLMGLDQNWRSLVLHKPSLLTWSGTMTGAVCLGVATPAGLASAQQQHWLPVNSLRMAGADAGGGSGAEAAGPGL